MPGWNGEPSGAETTLPTISCPITIGYSAGTRPVKILTSVPHMPSVSGRTVTMPSASGGGTSAKVTCIGSVNNAARSLFSPPQRGYRMHEVSWEMTTVTDSAVERLPGLAGQSFSATRQTAHEYVREVLRRAILSGDIPVGSRLVQAELATTLEVSTTPVREALRDLASEGLIQFDPHRGAVVSELSGEELQEIYEIRRPSRLDGRHPTAYVRLDLLIDVKSEFVFYFGIDSAPSSDSPNICDESSDRCLELHADERSVQSACRILFMESANCSQLAVSPSNRRRPAGVSV